MKSICLLVKFEKDITHNSYSWVYTGGCFKGNQPVLYDWAETDVKYNFHDVKIEVRYDNRPTAEITEDEEATT